MRIICEFLGVGGEFGWDGVEGSGFVNRDRNL